MTPPAGHLVHGASAEAEAARYLVDQGLELLTTNFRCRFGELDLVMRDGKVLVVVEVRSRRRTNVTTPEATVGRQKQRRLIGATRYLLVRYRQFADWPVRFDVVAITGELEKPEIRWFRSAFTLDVAGP